MAVFPKFENSRCGRYTNALHVSYHRAMHDHLEQQVASPERVNLSEEMISNYGDKVTELNDRSIVASASYDTQVGDSYDSERNRYLSMLFYMNDSFLQSMEEEKRQAAALLDTLLRKYKGMQNKGLEAKTGLINGLLQDLESSEYSGAVTTLSLSPILEQLKSKNDSYVDVRTRKIEERNVRRLQISTPELRKEVDTMLEEIQDLIRMSGLMASLNPEKADDCTYAKKLIEDLNGIICSFKTTHNLSEAQKKAKKNAAKKDNNTGTEKGEPAEEGGGTPAETVGEEIPSATPIPEEELTSE